MKKHPIFSNLVFFILLLFGATGLQAQYGQFDANRFFVLKGAEQESIRRPLADSESNFMSGSPIDHVMELEVEQGSPATEYSMLETLEIPEPEGYHYYTTRIQEKVFAFKDQPNSSQVELHQVVGGSWKWVATFSDRININGVFAHQNKLLVAGDFLGIQTATDTYFIEQLAVFDPVTAVFYEGGINGATLTLESTMCFYAPNDGLLFMSARNWESTSATALSYIEGDITTESWKKVSGFPEYNGHGVAGLGGYEEHVVAHLENGFIYHGFLGGSWTQSTTSFEVKAPLRTSVISAIKEENGQIRALVKADFIKIGLWDTEMELLELRDDFQSYQVLATKSELDNVGFVRGVEYLSPETLLFYGNHLKIDGGSNEESGALIYQAGVVNDVEEKRMGEWVVSIYPNPTTDFLHVDSDLPIEVTLYSSLGVYLERLEGEELVFDVSALPSGSYLMVVTTPKGRHVEQIAIQH